MGDNEKVSFLVSQRFVLVILLHLGTLSVHMVRINFSVAILCMVRNDLAVQNRTFNSYDFTNASAEVDNDEVCKDAFTSAQNNDSVDEGEFDWDKETRSKLLAMYFYGYIFTQIPGGWLASRYGGKRVWGVGQLVSALCVLSTPISARMHLYIVYTVRFILGFSAERSAGVTFPCISALLGRWAPPYQRTQLNLFPYAGGLVGGILAFSVSGLLCVYGFDNGWGSIFYVSVRIHRFLFTQMCGGVDYFFHFEYIDTLFIGMSFGGTFNLLWVVAWFLLTADRPALHKRISQQERSLIEHSIGKGNVQKVRRIPWLKIFSSGPVWGLLTAHMCNNYIAYTLITSLPTFMKESLKYDIKQNGALSSVPYLFQYVGAALVSYTSDIIRRRGWLSTKCVRKICQTTAFLGLCICSAVVGNVPCERRHFAVALLCLCSVFMSFNQGGYTVNTLDLAPSYAGVVLGITNTAATVPGMIAPIIAGALTPNKTAEEWRNVFYVCSGVAIFGGLVFLILADGEIQPWAIDSEKQHNFPLDDKNQPNDVHGIIDTEINHELKDGIDVK